MHNLHQLIDRYLKAKDAYYNSQPTMSDADFDDLERQIQKINPDHLALQTVGHKTRSAETAAHTTPMLSMDKSLSRQELSEWLCKRREETGTDHFTATAKLDGMSCELRYTNGLLTQAVSRGDGTTGADITAKARYIAHSTLSDNFTGAIRGELIITFDDFRALNSSLKEPIANPRNGVVGLINEEAILQDKLRFVSFIAYEVLGHHTATYADQLQFLINLGCKTPYTETFHFSVEVDHNDICDIFEQMRAENATAPWDGVVFRVNDEDAAQQLGRTSKSWKRSTAWKFDAKSASVRVTHIEWSPGTRDITPVVIFHPVELDGAVIQRAGGKSVKNLIEIGAYPGHFVKLVRSGGVIPWLQRDTSLPYDALAAAIQVLQNTPEQCPACGHRANLNPTREHLVCSNDQCRAKLARQLEILAKALDIKHIGPAVAQQLVDSGDVTELWHIARLDTRPLTCISHGIQLRLKQEIAHAKTKTHDPARILGGIGVDRVGEDTARKLLDSFHSLPALLQVNSQILSDKCRYSTEMADTITESLQRRAGEINKLLDLGIRIQDISTEPTTNPSPLRGASIAVTGSLINKTRDEFKAWLVKQGATLANSVTRNTTYLITNDPDSTSSKYKKAAELGVSILTQEQLETLAAPEEETDNE